jgi:hypothetical protein
LLTLCADLVLLSTLESGRIGEALSSVLQPATSTAEPTPADVLLQGRQQSDLLLQLSAYCGGYNAGSQRQHRFDVPAALDQIRALHGSLPSAGADFTSSMLYTVEPPLSAFAATSASDLQVHFRMRAATVAPHDLL